MRSVLPFAIACLIVSPVFADPGAVVQPPTITGTIVDVPGAGQFEMVVPLDEFEIEAGGKWKLKGGFRQQGLLGGRADVLIEEIEFDPDPSVFYNATLTNTTANVQTYTLSIALPTVFGAPNLIYGATTVGVIDNDVPGNGATLTSAAPTAVYQSIIDGATVGTLLNDPFTLVAPAMGVNSINATYGWNPSNIPINMFMGITHTFTLTPGDSASFLSRFDVIVPEPATLSLLALGGLLLMRRR